MNAVTYRNRRIEGRFTKSIAKVEWPTLGLIIASYAVWIGAGCLYAIAPVAAITVLALTIALQSSLQHEAIHRHPTRSVTLNEALVSLPLGLLMPYRRYREQHLLHHADHRLTDPYDDPESYYLAHSDLQRLPHGLRTVLRWNNVLIVRLVIGPAISAGIFLWSEARALVRPGDHRQKRADQIAWGLHLLGLAAIALIVHFAFALPVWAYLLSAYLGLSLLALRSFCEHQWAERPGARTVIVERSLLSLLFLNNNLHIVHHTHPGLPWYALPAAYRARRAEWQAINEGYVFRGYSAVLRSYALRAKEPVAHPARLTR